MVEVPGRMLLTMPCSSGDVVTSPCGPGLLAVGVFQTDFGVCASHTTRKQHLSPCA
eukprot:m.1115787 g.1115787  ORF g.1115787 m.1115787 type:complete len:56 (-) comp24371_c0_seq5:403-570(-)